MSHGCIKDIFGRATSHFSIFGGKSLLPLLLTVVMAAVAAPSVVYGKGGDRLTGFPSIDVRSGEQHAEAMAVDSDGNTIVVGTAGSGSTDYFVAKFKSDGSGLAWLPQSYGGSGTDIATAVAVDSQKNIVVTGYTWSGSHYDVHTVKYDGATGDPLWEHTWDNLAVHGDDYAISLALDDAGNIYIAGYSANGTKEYDYLVLKYPSNGSTPSWTELADDAAYPNNNNYLTAITAGIDGVAVTGHSSKGGADFDIVTRKYSFDGTMVREWRYSSPGSRDDKGIAVNMDSAGYVAVSGYVTNASNNKDMYSARYNPGSSTPVWEKIYNNGGGSSEDQPHALWVDALGDVYVAGTTVTLAGNTDIYAVRYSGATGNTVWQSTFNAGNGSADVPVGIVVDDAADGGVFVTGYTNVASTEDFITLKYRKDTGAVLWTRTWNNVFNLNDRPIGIGIQLPSRNVVVAGWTGGGASENDFVVLKYDFGPLNAPTKLVASAASSTSITLNWADNSTNEEKFVVQRKLGETGTWSSFEVPSPGPPNSAEPMTWTDPATLETNKYYYYRVMACIGAGEGNCSHPSDEARALTKVVAYDPPVWSYIYDGADHREDIPSAITFDSDNHPVVTGHSDLTEEGLEPGENTHTFDYMTFKLDRANGSVKWKARYDSGDGGTDMAAGVGLDSSGNVIVTGTAYLMSGGDKSDELYTRKVRTSTVTDPAVEPDFMWEDQFGTASGIDFATAISMVKDGSNNSVVLGYGQNAKNPPDYDLFVIKLDNNGVESWDPVVYDSGRGDEPAGLAVDAAGDIFITGYSYDRGVNPEGTYDWFTAKYSGTTGALIWQDTFNISNEVYGQSSGNDQALGIDVDAAGNAYVTGYATNADGRSVFYTVKYDGAATPTGDRRIWQKAFYFSTPGTGFDAEGIAVKVDPIDGAVVVAGTAYVSDTDSDFHLIRYNPADGSLTEGGTKPFWQRNFDSPGSYEYVTAMTMDSSGYIYVTGNTRSGPDTDPLADATSNIVSLIYDFEGTFLGAMRYDGNGRKDEATAITANYAGEAFVAGLMVNGAGNPDYAVLKQTNNYLLVPAPVTAMSQADFSKINLAWQHNNPNATFVIKRTTGPVTQYSTWTTLATPGAGTVSYTDTSLSANTNYCYSISALYNTLPSRDVVRCVTTRIEPPVLEPLTVGADPLVPTITLTWNNVANSTGYKIERRIGAGAWQELIVKGAGSITHSDTGLLQGTNYCYRVTALSSAGSSLPSSEQCAVTKPAAPTLNAPSNITNCQVDLSWNSIGGASSYTVYVKPSGGSYAAAPMCTGTGATWCTVTGLTPLVQHTFQVKAANASGESAGSNEQSATPTLGVPTLNAATNVTNQSMYFTWTAVAGASTYTLEMKDGVGIYGGVPGCDNTTGTSCSVTGLEPNHAYTFRVRANNSCGSSGWSTEKSATAALTPPTLSAPASVTDTSLSLSWTSAYGATNYTVESKISGGTYAPVPGCTNIAALTCGVTGLTANRTYYFHVKAANDVVNGDSNWSNEVSSKTKLGTPTLVSATGGTGQIVLTWGAVTEATSYKVERGSCNSSDTDPVLCTGLDANYSTTWTSLTTSATGTTYTSTGLSAGSNYRYRITAQVSGNTSALSNVLYAWTNMNKPTVTVTPASETSLTLAWDAQSGETNYRIERGPTSTGPWTVIVPAQAKNTTGYTDINLAQQTEYCYIVTAYSGATFPPPDAPSNPVCRTTPLPAPTLNALSEISSTQMKVTWGHLNSNTGYEVERCPSSTHNIPTGRTVGTPCTILPKVPTDIEYLVDTGLTAGYTYRYRVRATYGTSDYTGWSNEMWASTVPPKPVLNIPTAASTTQLNLSWTDVSGDNGYKLFWKERSGADCTAGTWTQIDLTTPSTTSYSHTGRSAGTYYCYYLVATGPPGPPLTPDSVASDVKSQMTFPAAPVQYDITNITGTSMTVNWSNVTGESGYHIYRKTGVNGAYSQIGSAGADTTSFVSSGLANGTLYYFMIYATSSVGNSASSNEKSATTTPSDPVVTGTVVSDDRIDICWPLVYGATYYKIDRKTGSDGTYGQIAAPAVTYGTLYCGESSPTVGCPSATPATYCYQDTGLTENTSYYYHVHAGNGTDSPGSIERILTTLSIASQNLTATALEGGLTIRLNWTPMTCSPEPCDNPDYFEIQRQVRDGMWMPLKVIEGTASSYVDNVAIDPNCRYRYRIRSLKGALQSPFAEAEAFAKPYLPGTNVCR